MGPSSQKPAIMVLTGIIAAIEVCAQRPKQGTALQPLVPVCGGARQARHLHAHNARQVRHGVCQRGTAQRQWPRTSRSICPDALADNIVKLDLPDLEACSMASPGR
jgi:hypothetical protein